MKRMIFLLVFFILYSLIAPSVSAGQEADRKGKKAIQFSYNSTSFIDGSEFGLGGKVWIKDNLTLGTSLLIDDQSIKMEFPTEDLADRKIDNTNIKVSIEVENHFKSLKKISPYIGGTVGIKMEKFYQEDQAPSNPNTEKSKRQCYFTGLLLGVEYWITDHISLSGSHYINFIYSNNKEEDDYGRKRELETTSTKINSSTSSLIISVYF